MLLSASQVGKSATAIRPSPALCDHTLLHRGVEDKRTQVSEGQARPVYYTALNTEPIHTLTEKSPYTLYTQSPYTLYTQRLTQPPKVGPRVR